MALYINFSPEDIITDEANKVTAGLFDGGAGTLGAGALITSSLSTTQKNYYFNLQYNSKDHISCTYGHIGGSGSDNITTTRETEAIYKQFANYLLPASTIVSWGDYNNEYIFQPGVKAGFQFTSGTLEHDVYVLSVERDLFKDRVNKKNWTLTLSGSRTTPNSGSFSSSVSPSTSWGGPSASLLQLTDDSKYREPLWTQVGPRYNIISGSTGIVSGSNYDLSSLNSDGATTKYGWFYPHIGVMVLSARELSSSIPGVPEFVTASQGYNGFWNYGGGSDTGVGSGLAPDLNNNATSNNAWKLARAIQLGTGHNNGGLSFRNEEDQTSVSYFCRATAPHFNATNNPTFYSGSLQPEGDTQPNGELQNLEMEGNPTTFITTVGLYDANDTMVAVGRLSKPIKKNFYEEAVIKVNLTY